MHTRLITLLFRQLFRYIYHNHERTVGLPGRSWHQLLESLIMQATRCIQFRNSYPSKYRGPVAPAWFSDSINIMPPAVMKLGVYSRCLSLSFPLISSFASFFSFSVSVLATDPQSMTEVPVWLKVKDTAATSSAEKRTTNEQTLMSASHLFHQW